MKKHLLPLALLVSGISPAQALDVGDISSFMNSDSSTLSKTIKNSTDSGRLINIRLERLSSPLDDGQVISMDKPDELLLTPASLLLPAQASEVIRFFYKGPADEKERYYRIVWFDQALSDAQRDNANRSAVATASARIGTIERCSGDRDRLAGIGERAVGRLVRGQLQRDRLPARHAGHGEHAAGLLPLRARRRDRDDGRSGRVGRRR